MKTAAYGQCEWPDACATLAKRFGNENS